MKRTVGLRLMRWKKTTDHARLGRRGAWNIWKVAKAAHSESK
jgi:hypothetical protein